MKRWLRAPVALALCVGLGWGVSRAQQDDEPPPSRVGRVAHVSGEVQSYSDEEGEWEDAVLNQPLTSRHSLWAAEGAQAEVGIGSAAIQIDGGTQADFSRIDDGGVSLNLPRGSAALQLRQVASGESWMLNAGGASLHAVIPGRYALSYSPNTKLVVAKVFSGAARVSVGGSSMALAAGQQVTVDTLAEEVRGQDAVQRSGFDNWALARADALDRSEAARHVSPEMTGADSLERYGSWSNDASYGAVWFPAAVASGWAPYRHGHWSWIPPWGWTWVDDAPWGFAPFHYGRWARFGPRWGWVPGPRVERPVYAPALVGFYGSGPGAAGHVGWFPLAPGEVYRPAWWRPGRHDDYVRRINRDARGRELPASDLRHIEKKAPSFRYALEPQAATVVPAAAFQGRGVPVGRSIVPWGRQQLSRLPAGAAVPAAPAPRPAVRTPATDRVGLSPALPAPDRRPPPARGDRRWEPPVAPGRPAVPSIRPPLPGQAAPQPAAEPPRREPQPPVVQPAPVLRAPQRDEPGRDRGHDGNRGREWDGRRDGRGDLRGEPRGEVRGEGRSEGRGEVRGERPGMRHPVVLPAPQQPPQPHPQPQAQPRPQPQPQPPAPRAPAPQAAPSPQPARLPAPEAPPRAQQPQRPHGEGREGRGGPGRRDEPPR